MKTKIIIASLLLAAYSISAPVKSVNLDTQNPDYDLPDLPILEGSAPTLRCYALQDGKTYTNIASDTVQFLAALTATNSAFITATNTSVSAANGYWDIPLSASQTATNGAHWYTILWYDSGGGLNYAGTGTVTFIETTATGVISTNDLTIPLNLDAYTITGTLPLENLETTGASIDDVILFNGTNPVWAAGGGGDINSDGSVIWTADQDHGTNAITGVSFMQYTGGTGDQGKVSWNIDEETLDIILNGAVLQVGQEVHYHCRNDTGSTITDGTVVYASGTIGASGRITIAEYISDGSIPVMLLLGITTEDIEAGGDGKVTEFGKVRGLDTSMWSEEVVLYPSETTEGVFTNVAPVFPNIAAPTAFVITSHANNGVLAVRVNNLDINEFVARADFGLRNALPETRPNVTFASDGTNVTATIDVTSGSTHDVYFDDALVEISVPVELTLDNGTTNSVQWQYVYATASGITNGTSLPTGEYAIMFVVGALDAQATSDDGTFACHRYTDQISGPNGDDRSLIQRLAWRARQEPARYGNVGNVLGTSTNVNGGGDDDVYMTCTAGIVIQLHPQTLDAVTNVTGSIDYHVLNDPAGVLHITNLNEIVQDANGNAVLNGNNSWFNIVIVRHANSGTTNSVDLDLGILLSKDDYAIQSSAQEDVSGFNIFGVDFELVGSTIPVAQISLNRNNANGGTWTAIVKSLLGSTVGQTGSGGGDAGAKNTFTDAEFSIVDDGDPTKELKFEASGIPNASTVILTAPGASGIIARTTDLSAYLALAGGTMASDIDMGGNDLTNAYALFSTNRLVVGFGLSLTGIHANTIGAIQNAYNTGTMTIGNISDGSIQSGTVLDPGVMEIGASASGSQQRGVVEGRMIIDTDAVAATQFGVCAGSATNSGEGAMQLLNLSGGQVANITAGGAASIGLGACTVSDSESIVAGDGGVSHGDGSITATGIIYAGDVITSEFNATNTCTIQYWSVSNRWAMVQIIGSTTNVTFVSPE
jgi:hypothetical protein